MSAIDVAIVGGGPAGATAARILAAGGLGVRLFESAAVPRYKTCGGGLVGRARRWLEIDLGAVTESECRRAEMRFLDAEVAYAVEESEPVVTMTMRADLDNALLAAARDAGAEVQPACPVTGLEAAADGVRLRTTYGELTTRFVIAADGVAGPTARWAGWRRQPPRAAAIESEIRVAPQCHARFANRAIFDFGVTGHGYAWVFPKRDHLSVGCLTTRGGGAPLGGQLDEYVSRLGLEPIERRDHGFAIPLAPRSTNLARDRVLLTGDAAGLADPVTGEGISYAALSGRLAAEAILQGRSRPTAVCRLYQRSLARAVLPELAISRRLARLLYDHPTLTRRLFERAGDPLVRAMAEVLAGRASFRSMLGDPASYLRLARRLATPVGGRRAD